MDFLTQKGIFYRNLLVGDASAAHNAKTGEIVFDFSFTNGPFREKPVFPRFSINAEALGFTSGRGKEGIQFDLTRQEAAQLINALLENDTENRGLIDKLHKQLIRQGGTITDSERERGEKS